MPQYATRVSMGSTIVYGPPLLVEYIKFYIQEGVGVDIRDH